MCGLLGIQRSSYYKWWDGGEARQVRHAADAVLAERIRDHFEFGDHTYGYRQLTVELAEDPEVEERAPSAVDVAGENPDQGQHHGDSQSVRRGDEGGGDVLAQDSGDVILLTFRVV